MRHTHLLLLVGLDIRHRENLGRLFDDGGAPQVQGECQPLPHALAMEFSERYGQVTAKILNIATANISLKNYQIVGQLGVEELLGRAGSVQDGQRVGGRLGEAVEKHI